MDIWPQVPGSRIARSTFDFNARGSVYNFSGLPHNLYWDLFGRLPAVCWNFAAAGVEGSAP